MTELEDDRAHVVGLAYRMLGSASEAEDVAQEALARWSSAPREGVRSRRAWLVRAATRVCVDRLRSAERNRTNYVGVDLPEPLVQGREGDELDESVSLALLTTLRRLKPTERALFLLHDVFDHTFEEVGEALELRADHCRQVAVRARKSLRLDAVRSDATPEEVERLTDAFFEAIESGSLERLRSLLARDVVLRSDGGGKASAAPAPLEGREAVVRFLSRVLVRRGESLVARRERRWFNGAPGVLVRDETGRVVTAFWLLVVDARVRAVFAQRNPDKLGAFG